MIKPGLDPARGPSAESGPASPYLSASARRRDDPTQALLMMGVSKKLAPSSPMRNTIRRVIREAYREACRKASRKAAFETLTVRVRLLRRSDLTTRALKRRIRAEADEALARIARRLS